MATLADVRAVQTNWRDVNSDISGLGVQAFEELFGERPQYAGLFRGITTSGELTLSNPKMREHAVRVFSAFDSWIHCLGDAPVIDGLLVLQGEEHRDRNVGETHFNDMRKALFSVLKKRLGAKFNEAAWHNVYDAILAGLAKGWNRKK